MKTSLSFLNLKKALLGGITFMILTFLMTAHNANAQVPCSPGTTPVADFYIDPGTGCRYDFSFCVQCSVVATSPWGLVTNLNIVIPPGCPPPPSSAISAIIDKILLAYSLNCLVGPCDEEGCTEVLINFPLCMRWMQYGYLDANNQYQYNTYLQTCPDGGYCQISAKLCRDAQGQIKRCPGWTYTAYDLSCPSTPQPAPTRPTIDFLGSQPASSCWQYRNCGPDL
jgi:hypothetical protein